MDDQPTTPPETPPVPPVAPAPTPAAPAAPTGVTTSATGGGINGPFPAELNHWNWGAFLLSWIWAIGNQTWIGLLALIPYVNFVVAIVLGVKGNEWAWQHRKFESVEQFKAVQSAWTKWGVILLVLGFVLGIAAGVLVAILAAHRVATGA